MIQTQGINHLGLAVNDLKASTAFFVNFLGWQESGFDASYPRTAVTDGVVKLTLWQVDATLDVVNFDRRKNVGLHHLALTLPSKEVLMALYEKAKIYVGINIEFAPELLGEGPRMHMMCFEPSGIRIEFIWSGQ